MLFRSLLVEYSKNYEGKIDLWVNLQKKLENNPPHFHSGSFSFVIWLEIPFDINEEMDRPSSRNSNSCYPAHFEFAFNSPENKIQMHYLPVDKKWRNKLAIFPSDLNHGVHPFYTSDDYRISVSGNFYFDTNLL